MASTRGRPRREPPGDAASGGEGIAGLLRSARERAGLSLRDLALRLGTSASTVSEAERGRDVLLSTLHGYAAALPALTPHRLLGRGPDPPPRASRAAWIHVRDALGFTVRKLRVEVAIGEGGARTTLLEATGVRCLLGRLHEPARAAALRQVLLRGSAAARLDLARAAPAGPDEAFTLADGCFRHEFSSVRSSGRRVLRYRRRQVPGEPTPSGVSPPGRLALSSPLEEGVSFSVELPIERLVLVARFAGGRPPAAVRAAAWSDLQSVAGDEPDFAPHLHPEGLTVRRDSRARSVRLVVDHPMLALHYGLGWGNRDVASATRRRPEQLGLAGHAERLRAAREEADLSQRELARRLGVSPVTVAGAEAGRDVRRTTLARYLDELASLTADDLFPPPPPEGPMSRLDVWEHLRALFGFEADEERKTLVITGEGDAHAVCETLRLRRVRPADGDLRLRYSSVQALGKRLPTVLKAIEEAMAAEAEESGLRTRVVSRQHGRLIHEIAVPARQALRGVSYARRLFNARFFDPEAEERDGQPEHDGAALVPFHPVRRLRLAVRFPRGHWPRRVWFGVHPRMMLTGPLPEADVAPRLHPEGLTVDRCERSRTLTLEADHPLVGFMYDIFWERP